MVDKLLLRQSDLCIISLNKTQACIKGTHLILYGATTEGGSSPYSPVKLFRSV